MIRGERNVNRGLSPQNETVLQIGLETGRKTIVRRRRRSLQVSDTERANRVSRWWNEKARESFLLGALIWREEKAANMTQRVELNVETGALIMGIAETENTLRELFRTAQGMAIRAEDLVQRLKNESKTIEDKLGSQSTWVKSYLLWNVDLLAEEYNLNKKNARGLKDFVQSQAYLL